MKGRFFLDVIVGQCPSIFQLLSCKDKPLLIRGNTFFVLDLCFNILDGVRWLNIEGNCLSGEGLHKDLHATSQSENQVKSGLFLDVVVRESSSILELLSSEDEPLLIRRDAFLVLDLGLDVFNGVRGLNIEGDCFASEGLYENLHCCVFY
jgi:hypothetical protein